VRRVVVGLAALQVALVVIQFFLAAKGALDPAPLDDAYQLHRIVGSALVLVGLLVTGAAALARLPGRVIGRCGVVVGLLVLQSVIRLIAGAFDDDGGNATTAGTLIFGLHALNALGILALSGRILDQARRGDRRPVVDGAATPARPAS
jgi:hypothetical protein